jgi:hypothetical protein
MCLDKKMVLNTRFQFPFRGYDSLKKCFNALHGALS